MSGAGPDGTRPAMHVPRHRATATDPRGATPTEYRAPIPSQPERPNVEHDSAQPVHLAADATFAVVPTWVIACGNSRAIHLYAVLRRYADQGGEAWPSRATLAERMGCSRPTVDRALAALVKHGALTVVHRFDDAGSMTSSLYRLHSQPGGNPVDHKGGAITRDSRAAITRDGTLASPVKHEREPLNKNTPLPPQSGGATSCRSHKRPRRGCAACATPAPVRPEWCGECDERTRLVDTGRTGVRRCQTCHPLGAFAGGQP